MAVSTELENIKDTDIKLEKLFKSKGTPNGKTNKQVIQKGNKEKSPKKKNDDKHACKKSPNKDAKRRQIKCMTKLITGVSGIRHG